MTMAPQTLTGDRLEVGDIIRDTEGHGKTNPWGPDLTDELFVKKRWRGESWLLAPIVENGQVTSGAKTFAVTFDDITDRLASGRYERVDCAVDRSLDLDALPTEPGDDVYLRFGDVPTEERSMNHTDGHRESGVSVYSATLEAAPVGVDEPGVYVPHGPKLLQTILLMHRDTFLVTGTQVGTGTDGEPLLRDVEVIAEVRGAKGCHGYVPIDAPSADDRTNNQ